MNLYLFLAEATNSGATDQSLLGKLGSFFPFILLLGVLYFYMIRTNKGKDRKATDRLNNLKKNDRVMTAGGIFGTVVDIRDKEIVLKVDETTNTKMRFSREAIRTVIEDEPAK